MEQQSRADGKDAAAPTATPTPRDAARALPLGLLVGVFIALAALAAAEQRFALGAVFRPITLGDDAARPGIGSRLNDICASRDGEQITVVGDGGLILFSADAGQTWRREILPAGAPQSAPESRAKKRAGLDWLPLAQAWAGDPKEFEAFNAQQNALQNQAAKQDPGRANAAVQQTPPSAEPEAMNQQAPPRQQPEPGPVPGEGRPVREGPAQNQNLHAVVCSGDGLAVAAGGGGVIALRERAGADWRLVPTPGYPELYDIDFDGTDRFWAVGDGGTLWTSRDAGRSWTSEIEFGPSATWLAVRALPDSEVITVGSGGIVFDSRTPPAQEGDGPTLRTVVTETGYAAIALGDDGEVVGLRADALADGGPYLATRPAPNAKLPKAVHAAAGSGETTSPQDPVSIWTVGPRGAFAKLTFDSNLELVGVPQVSEPLADGRDLRAIHVTAQGRAWIVGDAGALLSSDDLGLTWREHTRAPDAPAGLGALRLPSPAWVAFAALAFIGLLFYAQRRTQVNQVPIDAVAQATVSDRPLSGDAPDALGLRAIAQSLAAFMLNESTRPPLTVAVRGAWGSGKSSLMSLLCDDMEKRTGYRPVWFNAWHHQSGEQLLASLFAAIRAQAMPRIWSFAGMSLRTELLWLRTRRSPTWTLLMLALAGMFLFSVTHEQDFLEAGAGIMLSKLLSLVDASNAQATEDAARTLGPLGAALLPLLALIQTLRAFKLNPASLVTAATAGGSAQKHQPAARHRFAAEFEDFTEALKPWRLVLVIDDLDRCTPEHIAEIMETVNFLVTSGECFVVLGMETLWVEAALAVQLEKLSKKMEERRIAAQRPEDEDLIHRYLRKLINIEIKVPRADNQAALRVLSGADNADDTSDAEKLRQTAEHLRLKSARQRRRAMLARAAGALIAVGLTGGTYLASRYVPAWPLAEPEPEAAAASGEQTLRCEVKSSNAQTLSCVSTPLAQSPADPASAPASGDAAAAASQSAESKDSGAAERREPQTAIFAAAPSPSLLSAAALAAAVLALMLAVLLRLRTGSVLIRDSREFAEALRIWLPLIVRRVGTPRDLKRFLNLLRYLAARLPPRESADPRDAAHLVAFVVQRKLFGIDPTMTPRGSGGSDATQDSATLEQATTEMVVRCRLDHQKAFGDTSFDDQRLGALALLEAEIDFR